MEEIRDELIDTSELEIKELEGYYDVFNSVENKIKDGENEANSNIEEIKKQNEEARNYMPVYTDEELESLDDDYEEVDDYYDNVDYDDFDKYYDED